MRTARAALAILLCFAVPLHAETTSDPLWTMLSTYVLTPDARSVAAEGDAADSKGLAALQADLSLLADGFEAFRDEAQVQDSLRKLEPRMSPELKPFFQDRASSLDAVYRTLAVTDYSWALRFPEPPCGPAEKRGALLAAEDGLFADAKGESSPWLVALLGPAAKGKSAAAALDRASAKAHLSPEAYERLRAKARRLSLALTSERAEGAVRARLYCERGAVYEELAAHHRAKGAGPISAARAAVAKPEESVFVVVANGRRAAATLVATKAGPLLITDGMIVDGVDHPELFAYGDDGKPVALTATVTRRHPFIRIASLSYAETLPRPALTLAAKAPAKEELVTAVGHSEVSGLWTKSSGLVTKVEDLRFQTDAVLSPEFTGGPVLDQAGELAGMLVLHPAETEEGEWPVAIPAPLLTRWLEEPDLAVPAPDTAVIEDAGTAAILSRTRPAPIESGLGTWTIPPMGPPPPSVRGVCVSGCNIPSAPRRSYSSYSGGSSYSSGSGGAELGQALGQALAPLVEALIFQGIPALFRGIGKLFKKKPESGSSSIAHAVHSPKPAPAQKPVVKKEPPPKPKPPVLSYTVSTSATENETVFTVVATSNRTELPVGGHTVSFTVEGLPEPLTAETDSSGMAILKVKQAPSAIAFNDLAEESKKHPQPVEAGKKLSQSLCEGTLLVAGGAVVAVAAVRVAPQFAVIGAMNVATNPADVRRCVEFAKAAGTAAAAACTSMLGDELPKKAEPAAPAKSVSAAPRTANKAVEARSSSAHDELAKMAGEAPPDAGASDDSVAGQPADPGEEPPDDEEGPSNELRKPRAENPRLQRAIDALFKPTDKLRGGTAGAIRAELRSGVPTQNRFHSIKGSERAAQLRKILREEKLSDVDRATAEALAKDLENALRGL